MKRTISFKYINYTLHALIWGTVLFFPYFIAPARNGFRIGIVPGVFITLMGLVHMAVFYTNALVLYPRLLNRRFWWFYIPSAIGLVFASFQVKYFITATWFPQIMADREVYRFIFPPSIGALVISIVYRWLINRVRSENVRKEKQAQQLITELKFLRSQISPHFLFNVLTNLVSLARKKSEKLEPSLILLSNLMRYMLYDTQGKKVSLTKETEYLSSYIELQKLRFENDVDIDNQINITEAGSNAIIEPMLLIPFVENAFKHGVGSLTDPFIKIDLNVTGNTLLFDVKNKIEAGPDTSKDEDSGIGINNVVLRLNLLYQGKHTLKINDNDGIFHISLTLNLE